MKDFKQKIKSHLFGYHQSDLAGSTKNLQNESFKTFEL